MMLRDEPLTYSFLPCTLAENCIVIAEGAMQLDGAFHAAALGFPPCEPRENLPMAAQVRAMGGLGKNVSG